MEKILKVENIKKVFKVSGGIFKKDYTSVYAVKGAHFEVEEGKTYGIVGESGSGKTTLARIILRLEKADDGKITFLGKDFLSLKGKELREARKNMQVVFQDPASSLDPKMTIGETISEPLLIHKVGTKSQRKEKVIELLRIVGLDESFYSKYPYELSGGQKQRVGIARAIALNPKLIICDEPVSALDISIQAQILNLLKDLQERLKISYIFIAHSLDVVDYISDDVAVMLLGSFVETGSKESIFNNPLHPYTKLLMKSAPIADPKAKRERIEVEEEISSTPISGCPFYFRCPIKKEICSREDAVLKEIEKNHFVACHSI